MTHFRIDVVSDTVCPWCYVGRKQVQRAQQLWAQRHPSSADTFSVRYAPFQLNPDSPRGPGHSVDKQGYYVQRFGAERTAMIQERLRAVGDAVGIHFKFGGRVGNSRDSHRLIHLALQKHGEETHLKVVDGLFAAYFENEKDITDYDVLREVAKGADIPEEEFNKAIVESDEGGEEVDAAAGTARFRGISGVPDYTIQGKYRLSGAQDATEFVKVFERVKAEEDA